MSSSAQECQLPVGTVCLVRVLGHTLRILLVLLSGAASCNAQGSANSAQEKHPTALELAKNCTLDYRTEYVMPVVTLHVPLRMLDSFALNELIHSVVGTNCPAGPYGVKTLTLGGKGLLDALQIESGLGRRQMRMRFNGMAPDQYDAWLLARGGDIKEAGEPRIEMKTLPDIPMGRVYKLHYPTTIEGREDTAEVACNGYPGERACGSSVYPYFGLYVHYSLSQTELGIPDVVSTDPTSEPGAVLEFDSRLRALIRTFEQVHL